MWLQCLKSMLRSVSTVFGNRFVYAPVWILSTEKIVHCIIIWFHDSGWLSCSHFDRKPTWLLKLNALNEAAPKPTMGGFTQQESQESDGPSYFWHIELARPGFHPGVLPHISPHCHIIQSLFLPLSSGFIVKVKIILKSICVKFRKLKADTVSRVFSSIARFTPLSNFLRAFSTSMENPKPARR